MIMNRDGDRRVSSIAVSLVLAIAVASAVCWAQQGAATGNPLVLRTTSLPKGFLRQPYQARLEAEGGITPRKWEVSEGSLPSGIVLQADGFLTGTPVETGEFHFTATVTDSGRPAYQRQQQLSLVVVAPLMVQWSRYPKVTGQRLEGSITASNQTDRDFDLTVIIVAVNENGRATAIGYQHFPLKKNTEGVEIPFGESLPRGSYELNVDAVAEVAATGSIFRARLVPKERFQVQVSP
ncbi:MAG: putative Ig domain-containing protein [Terriglobales bacterium]